MSKKKRLVDMRWKDVTGRVWEVVEQVNPNRFRVRAIFVNDLGGTTVRTGEVAASSVRDCYAKYGTEELAGTQDRPILLKGWEFCEGDECPERASGSFVDLVHKDGKAEYQQWFHQIDWSTVKLFKLSEPATPPSHHTAVDFQGKWAPDVCPITLLPFFMWIQDESGQWVPTYGGPYDSYTIPVPDTKGAKNREDVEYTRQRFCHDEGCWRDHEVVEERVVTEEKLIELGAWGD